MTIGKFCFRPVGQGLFYTGIIKQNNFNDFVFVYDCGTSSDQHYLNEEIRKFKQNICTIDLLVISHFHKDHISGLIELIKDIKVKTVILPYMNERDRTLYSLWAINDETMIRFYKNPTAFFKEINLKTTVIELGGKENESKESDNMISNPDFQLAELLNNNINYSFYDYSQKRHFNGSSPVWNFKFYNKYEEVKLDEFKLKMKKILKGNIENKLKQSTGLDEISQCYEEYFTDNKSDKNVHINNTSILLLHYPEEFSFMRHMAYNTQNLNYPSNYYNFNYSVFTDIKHQTLLTGDINLKYPTWKDANKFLKFKSGVFTLPHHGSKHNFSLATLSHIKNSVFVSSSGIGNQYSHPYSTFVNKIIMNKDLFANVNELNGYFYIIEAKKSF